MVDDWLHAKALQHQTKQLSVTKVLISEAGAVAGYYSLATGQVDFQDLPSEISKSLPRRLLPVAVLAWFGIDHRYQRKGLGQKLLAQALRDCYEAGRTFAFIAVILDCIDEAAKNFYLRYDFRELPGHPFKLYLSSRQLDQMMNPVK